MTDRTRAALSAQIALALSKLAQHVEPRGPHAWEFPRRDGTPRTGTARLCGDWLVLDAPYAVPAASDRPVRAWDLLCGNGRLPIGVKYALDERNGLRIRAEWPVADEFDADEVAALVRRFLAAHASLERGMRRQGQKRAVHSFNRTSAAPAPNAADLGELCTAAGWRYVERAGGRLAIDLQCGSNFCEALLGPDGAGLRCAVELPVANTLGPTSRHALACLLLALGGAVRMVRAAADDSNASQPRLEVWLPGCATDAQLGHALAALSVACRWGAREVRALQDEQIARAFRAARTDVGEGFPWSS
jgi:hypothetical protein